MTEESARHRLRQAIALLTAYCDDQPEALKAITGDLSEHLDAATDLLHSLPAGATAPKKELFVLLNAVHLASNELRGTVAGTVGLAHVLVQHVAALTDKTESEVLQELALRSA